MPEVANSIATALTGLTLGLMSAMVAIVLSERLCRRLLDRYGQDSFDSDYPPVRLPEISSKWLQVLIFLMLVLISIFVFVRREDGLEASMVVLFCALSLMLAYIDLRIGLLPDVLTLPLLALGLTYQVLAGVGDFASGAAGAALSYGLLRGVFGLFYWKTGRAGMGFGDFKFAAAIGAWVGVTSVPLLLLIASGTGVLLGLLARSFGKLDQGCAFPFGPFLAIAGILIFLCG